MKDLEHCRQWKMAAKYPKYGENTATENLKNFCVFSLHFKLDDYELNFLGQTERKKMKNVKSPLDDAK